MHGSSWLSLNQATIRRETCRNSNRDFLIDAYNVISKSGSNAAGLSRYYHIRINSLVDTDRDDLNYIDKVSADNTKCIRCGNSRLLNIKRRRRANKSTARKHCRYLRSLSEEFCDKCHSKIVHHLQGRQAIRDKRPGKKPSAPTEQKNKALIVQTDPQTTNKATFSKRLKLAAPRQPLQKPQPSSRLRAFTCLFKE